MNRLRLCNRRFYVAYDSFVSPYFLALWDYVSHEHPYRFYLQSSLSSVKSVFSQVCAYWIAALVLLACVCPTANASSVKHFFRGSTFPSTNVRSLAMDKFPMLMKLNHPLLHASACHFFTHWSLMTALTSQACLKSFRCFGRKLLLPDFSFCTAFFSYWRLVRQSLRDTRR